MIITNGYITFKEESEGSQIDPITGFPIASTHTWGNTIECQWRHAKMDMQAMDEGNRFVNVTYVILIELPTDLTDPKAIQLYDSNNNLKGEYVVIRVDRMEEVNKLKITV